MSCLPHWLPSSLLVRIKRLTPTCDEVMLTWSERSSASRWSCSLWVTCFTSSPISRPTNDVIAVKIRSTSRNFFLISLCRRRLVGYTSSTALYNQCTLPAEGITLNDQLRSLRLYNAAMDSSVGVIALLSVRITAVIDISELPNLFIRENTLHGDLTAQFSLHGDVWVLLILTGLLNANHSVSGKSDTLGEFRSQSPEALCLYAPYTTPVPVPPQPLRLCDIKLSGFRRSPSMFNLSDSQVQHSARPTVSVRCSGGGREGAGGAYAPGRRPRGGAVRA